MIPAFEYLRPQSLNEALQILNERAGTVTVIAGGTDVITGMQQSDLRFAKAKCLLDIHDLAELRVIDQSGRIGAAATFSELASHSGLRQRFPMLCDAAASVGSVQIRNRATVGGNFVNNAACADSVPPLLAYDARVCLRSARGERKFPLAEFLLGPNRTALADNELVTDIVLPEPPAGAVSRFYKLGRRRGIAISRLTLAVLLHVEQDQILELRVASGAVMPIGMRFPDLEARAQNLPANQATWAQLARELGRAVLERTGLRWSSDYKLPVLQQLLFNLLCELAGEARA